MTRYWINTVSLEHVEAGRDGGFTQAEHGGSRALKRLARGDYIAFYSPRTRLHGGNLLQEFTAIGRVVDDEPYKDGMSAHPHPFRRRLEFLPCRAASVRPMIADFLFITNAARWGMPFRRGLFEIPEDDFLRIARAMEAPLPPPGESA